jgi:hypothetical protein
MEINNSRVLLREEFRIGRDAFTIAKVVITGNEKKLKKSS